MRNIIELMLERESQEVVTDYCGRNERIITSPKLKGSFHSTVYFSENYPLFHDPKLLHSLNDMLPIELDPQTYFFDVFGECLVLRYENREVRKINEKLKQDIERQREEIWPELSLSWKSILNQFSRKGEISKYPYFNPHITFSKNFDKRKLEKLPPFEEFLILESTNFKFKN